MIKANLLDLVGNTPVVRLSKPTTTQPNVYAKLEHYNPTGSIKDRPAAFIVRRLLLRGEIDHGSTLIESSSGNFGVALAAICRAEGIRFVCLVDPLVLPENEFLLRQYGAEVVKVDKPDDTGGFLKTRIATAKQLEQSTPKALWLNQYGNAGNVQAHYFGTGMEIYKDFADVGLDTVVVPVGSGGTVTGVSRLLKEHFPKIHVVAVDTVGSVIFGGTGRRRHIPGMGSSIRPPILDGAMIDEVIAVEEPSMVQACVEMLQDFGLFVGGSSGAAYCAAMQLRERYEINSVKECEAEPRRGSPNILAIFPDRGDRYASTLYNERWLRETYPQMAQPLSEKLQRAMRGDLRKDPVANPRTEALNAWL